MKKCIIKYFVLLLFALTGCSKTVSLQEATAVDNISDDAIADDVITETTVDTDISTTISESEESVSNRQIPVYVCGAVNNPGVYYLDSNSIKEDALYKAGGLSEGAAIDYINLAEPIEENEKIYFPYLEELSDSYNLTCDSGASGGNDENTGKVNINSANKETLMTLPGIGESKAEAIIQYREEHGPYQDISDIMKITGIKSGVYNKIKDLITV